MLPWIQVYSNLAEHPKIYALVDRLGLRRNYEAVGIVVSLWLWAAKNAPNGDLSGFPERAIAAAIGVSGKKEKVLCKALVESGWLDEKSSGGFLIHDWDEYAELLIAFEKKQRRLGKARVERYRKKMSAENDTPFQKKSVTATKIDNSNSKCNAEISVTDVNCNAENGVTSAKCNAYTKPDQTKQNQTIAVCPPSAPRWRSFWSGVRGWRRRVCAGRWTLPRTMGKCSGAMSVGFSKTGSRRGCGRPSRWRGGSSGGGRRELALPPKHPLLT